MLKYLFFFCTICCAYAQKEYCFQYDNAGNQRTALLCLNANDPLTDEQLFSAPTALQQALSVTEATKITLVGAPNPVTDDLSVYWEHTDNVALTQLSVLNITMQVMYQTTAIPAQKPFHIPVQGLVPGTYFLVATFADGSHKVFKIIKQ